jgi:hypothetical protein
VRAQLRGRGGLGAGVAEPRAVHGGDRRGVAGDGGVDDVLEQRALVAEDVVHGLHGHARPVGDLLQVGGSVPLFDEQLAGRLDDPLAGPARPFGPLVRLLDVVHSLSLYLESLTREQL